MRFHKNNKNKKNKINMRKNITLITVLLTFPVIIGNNKNIVNDIYIYIYIYENYVTQI